ncbi:MAG: PQQ-binding-like beta-propeller repeat protein [Verrucomicrobia bacterium]|nr:PQQ-binding-like beta-propeller repeat protein [Verrucomicrobiota bacterium]
MKIKTSVLLCFVFTAAVANAADPWWPQFRGPNCSGVSESAKPPVEFGPGTNQLWKIAVPPGPSSPCVWADRIFLTAFDAGKLEVLCFARGDGKLLWKSAVPAEKLEEFHVTEGSPAASSCATDGQRVVSYFGSFGLVCHDFAGKELWRHPLPVAQSPGGFGSGGSPSLAGGLVLLNRDQTTGCSLLAVDVKTGKKVWEAARADVMPGFGSPIVWKNGGADEVVMSGSLKLKAYDLKTGAERWSLAGMPSFTCTTPVVGDGLLFFAGWAPGKGDFQMPTWEQMLQKYDKNKDGIITPDEVKGTDMETFFRAQDINRDGKLTKEDNDMMRAMMAKGENVLLAVKPGGKGELSEDKVAWKQTRGLPYVPSPLYYQGRIYLIRDGGMASCFDAKMGKVFYQQERLNAIGSYYASPVAADGHIYVASLNGKVTVLQSGGDAPKILHQAEFGERILATPALVEKKLYLRTPTALFAFGK